MFRFVEQRKIYFFRTAIKFVPFLNNLYKYCLNFIDLFSTYIYIYIYIFSGKTVFISLKVVLFYACLRTFMRITLKIKKKYPVEKFLTMASTETLSA